jgi:hypothetical protein
LFGLPGRSGGTQILPVRKISKVDTRSQATAYGGGAVVLAIPFVLVGAYFALAGFGFLPLPGKANAPLEIIGFVGLAFFIAGMTLVVHGCRGMLNKVRMRRVAQRHLSEPWFLDHAWDPQGIRDNASGRAGGGIAGLLLLTVFLVPFNWWAFWSGEGALMLTFVVCIFDLCLLLVVGATVYRIVQLAKYGHARLSFRRFPFHPGDKLHVALSGTPRDNLSATLRFVEERFETHGSGKNRSRQLVSYEHFGERRAVPEVLGAPEVEVSFDLPDNEEWVTELSGAPVRYWELLVESQQPGVDFRTTFPLPVYRRN